MTKRNSSLIALAAVLLLVTTAAVAQAASNPNKTSTKKATKWIGKTSLSQFPGSGFRADAVSALAAAHRAGAGTGNGAANRFVASLEDNTTDYATSAGATAKLILAAVASGHNPRCFGPSSGRTDLYNQLQTFYEPNGQYGATAFDQGLAMVALKAAHQRIPTGAVKFAKRQRGSHGWNFPLSKSSGDDVESTSLIIQGLRAAGVSKNDAAIRSAYKWLTYQRNTTYGFNPDQEAGETQANTTALAIEAADAIGKNNQNAKRALRLLQSKNGSFRSTASAEGDFAGVATSEAVTALSGAHYPVVARKTAAKSCA